MLIIKPTGQKEVMGMKLWNKIKNYMSKTGDKIYKEVNSDFRSESKKFEPKQEPVKKSWLITYEIYRVTSSITTKVDIGTKIIEAVNIREAYESLRKENQKLVITYIYEL